MSSTDYFNNIPHECPSLTAFIWSSHPLSTRLISTAGTLSFIGVESMIAPYSLCVKPLLMRCYFQFSWLTCHQIIDRLYIGITLKPQIEIIRSYQ